jgi:hypothetical protein
MRTSSNAPSVPKGYYNLVLLSFRKEMTLFILQILAWEAPRWTGTIQGKVAIWTAFQPVKVNLQLGFPTQGVRHNLQGNLEEACPWWCHFMLRVIMQGKEALSPRIRKDELTNGVIDLAKPLIEGVTRRCSMWGIKEAQTIRQIQWAKSMIGFKDDRMINDHEVIEQGTTW